jgi:prevent-host-death family protein
MSDNAHELAVSDARDRLADVINEAAYGGRVTYLTRHGRRLAAIVSVEAAEAAERWEDEQLGRMADEAVEEMARTGEKPVSLDEVRRELGV